MGDHFVLLVDRLLTESTLEAALESHNRLIGLKTDDLESDFKLKDYGDDLTPRKMVECRICQDEDWDSNMETPCSCCGSLKYAHRRCVQRWCNEKGDTVCEICHQNFKPGYTAPPPIFRLGNIPMNFRGNWEIARRDVNNPRLITVVSTDRSYLDSTNEEIAVATSRSVMCCRAVAVIFMILLVLRHTLPVIVNRAGDYSFPLIMLLLLRIVGIILPIYIIMKAVMGVLHRRHNQVNLSLGSPDEESGTSTTTQPQNDPIPV
ncbi:OLC1v1032138C1 [Oldenlandia corymbosa var. corymbosa]|uniref:OLC1v1032138C1 n=1 Tax=Oldenlandia corymbosa var. corymbosa TaxID=529605 RepID=A0AAV1CMZ0_OLDCO|nr:OLC1v1032138C1 [Oldenlandia corymbosa var. corymbosa]